MREKNNKTKVIRWRCTENEYELIALQSKQFRSSSEYIRKALLGKGTTLINTVEYLRALNAISIEMKRIGNNINQFAKYANQRREVGEDRVIDDYNKLIGELIRIERELIMLYRKIIAL